VVAYIIIFNLIALDLIALGFAIFLHLVPPNAYKSYQEALQHQMSSPPPPTKPLSDTLKKTEQPKRVEKE